MKSSRRLLLLPVVAALAAVGVAVAARQREPGDEVVAPFAIDGTYGRASVDEHVGVLGIGELRTVRATGQFVVVDAVPEHIDPGAEVVAVRALFWGRGVTAAHYRRFPGYPVATCWNGSLHGHGPTYPVNDLVVNPGDHVVFLVYVRATKVGRTGVSGLVVRYQFGGRVQAARTRAGRFEVSAHPAGQLPAVDGTAGRCDPTADDGRDFASRYPGYPA